MEKTPLTGSSVEADVSFGKDGDNFGLAVDLFVNIPDMDQEQAEALVAKAPAGGPLLPRHSRQHRGKS